MEKLDILSRFESDGIFQINGREVPGHLIYDINGSFDSENVSLETDSWLFPNAIFLKLDGDLIIVKHFNGIIDKNVNISLFYPQTHFSSPDSMEFWLNQAPGKMITVCTTRLIIISNDDYFSNYDQEKNPIFDNMVLEFKDLYNTDDNIELNGINEHSKIRVIKSEEKYIMRIQYDEAVPFAVHFKNNQVIQDIITLIYGVPKYIYNVYTINNKNIFMLFYKQGRYEKDNFATKRTYYDVCFILQEFNKVIYSYVSKMLFNDYYVQFFLMAQYFNLHKPIKYLYFIESLESYFEKKELGKSDDYKKAFLSKRVYKGNEGLGTKIEFIFLEFIKDMNIKNFISHAFIEKIKNSRAFMAHSGAFPNQDKNIFKPEHLSAINDLLLLVNSYCIFKELGLENEVIKKWMQQKLETTIWSMKGLNLIEE